MTVNVSVLPVKIRVEDLSHYQDCKNKWKDKKIQMLHIHQ